MKRISDAAQAIIKICEAVDCYKAATEAIAVSVGKFGTITLNLCHECMVTKFKTIPLQDTIAKKNKYTDQKAPPNQPADDSECFPDYQNHV